ncbi:hypothetical protein MRX96_044854 [Rhipicephalus microplus]
MKIAIALVASLVGVLIVPMANDSEAKVGLALAPFIWAGHMAKDATHTLVAYKLSLATKALAMITGNRSFRASIAYDSRLERYQDAPAEVVHNGIVWNHLKNMAAMTPAPIPVHVENKVKVEWLPGIKKPAIHLPYTPDNAQGCSSPRLSMAEVAGSDILQAKADLLRSQVNGKLRHLGSKTAGLLGFQSNSAGHLTGPKYASGYIKGGFRVGHGTGPVADIQLGSDAAPATASPGDARSFDNTEHNATTNHSRPVRSPPWRPTRRRRSRAVAAIPCPSRYPGCRVNPKHLAQLGESSM